MKCLILAGGSGTGLWPLSRAGFPKQFLKLKDKEKSLFQMTFERCRQLAQDTDIFIVTTERYKYLIAAQAGELGCQLKMEQVFVEPAEKNTLPAICYGVNKIQKNGDDLVGVFLSNQITEYKENIADILDRVLALANDNLITFGIIPARPHTDYSYIKKSWPLEAGFLVSEFKEKPDYLTAQQYVNEGYFWNSGMLLFRTDLFMEEVSIYCPEVYEIFAHNHIEQHYQRTPGISVDKGLMEKSKRLAVVPLDIKWTDLSSFDDFYDEFVTDEKGNIKFNKDILINSSNNLLYTNRTVAAVDVDDLIVVDDNDALLLCKKGQSQKVKEVVERLRINADPRLDANMTGYRPWGSYTVLEEGKSYKIKRITVLPGQELSYQLHYHRSEHWVVVKGTATVTIDGQEQFIRCGESAFIKCGFKHRLKNPGKILLEVIEVQLGEYLEEDDIIRFIDEYGRVNK